MLPRRTELVRGFGRRAAARQVLAANVDVVLVVVSLASAPSPARLDRMLAVAWDSGAQPVVVLTKADLSRTAESERDEVAETALAAPVLLTSTADGRGLDELRGHLRPGRTVRAARRVRRRQVQPAERAGRHRGRPGRRRRAHRQGTAHDRRAASWSCCPAWARSWTRPACGGCSCGSPTQGLERAFADVAELAGRCRFRDCRHVDEPGCAVAAAVAAGTLSARRVASHAKLEREVAWLRDRYDARLRAEQRRRWREIARAMRSSPRR